MLIALDLAWASWGLNPTVPAQFFDISDSAADQGRLFWFDDYRYDVTFGSGKEEAVQIKGYFDLNDYRRARDQWRVVRTSMLPNMNMLDRVSSLNNNDPLLPSYHSQYIDLIESAGSKAGSLLRAAGVDRVYGRVPDGWGGENPASAPFAAEISPAWLVTQVEWADSDSAATAALSDPAWNPMELVILVGDEIVPESVPAVSGRVTLAKNLPTERRYQVSSDSPAYLVMAETWYPGWSVTVNGQRTDLERANLAFQAVRVPAGQSEVVLSYRVNHFSAGAAISMIGLFAAFGLFLAPGVWRWVRAR
jgi:hypothetical protein